MHECVVYLRPGYSLSATFGHVVSHSVLHVSSAINLVRVVSLQSKQEDYVYSVKIQDSLNFEELLQSTCTKNVFDHKHDVN